MSEYVTRAHLDSLLGGLNKVTGKVVREALDLRDAKIANLEQRLSEMEDMMTRPST